ncbi:hypothetical protein PTMSG1_06251 [Pyrenophora teres f. maculata]|nr:hypothetical protein PTMSG1_06251 [Pyrenophora teres f. maculata]
MDATPLEIPELAVCVLNYLKLQDVANMRATHPRIKDIVDNTPIVQRRLWKRTNLIIEGENPLFNPLAVPQVRDPSGRTFEERHHRFHWNIHAALEAGTNVPTLC